MMASVEIKVENLKKKDVGDILRELSAEVVPILTTAATEILEYPSEDVSGLPAYIIAKMILEDAIKYERLDRRVKGYNQTFLDACKTFVPNDGDTLPSITINDTLAEGKPSLRGTLESIDNTLKRTETVLRRMETKPEEFGRDQTL